MRILLVNDYAHPFGGAEISQEVLRGALRRRGHEVRLLASGSWMHSPHSPPDYECLGTVSRFRTMLQALNPWAAHGLRRALAEFRPDVVHVRLFLTQLSPLILPALRKVPSLHHVTWYRPVCPIGTKVLPDGSACRERAGVACCSHGCVPPRDWLPLLIQINLWRRWSGVFGATVANSEEGRCLMTAEGFQHANPVQVLWNGVPVVMPRPPLPPNPTLLFAGRLVHQKGADILLRAFAAVTKPFPQARLLIVGDGPERTALSKLARDLELPASAVCILGHLERPELERHAAAAWAQIVPSRWAESFGNVAAEAMMRGTAVIASRIGAMADYIQDGETGILVPPGDETVLADAMVQILRDRELAEAMGCRGREFALRELNADGWAQRFESMYVRLIQQTTKADSST